MEYFGCHEFTGDLVKYSFGLDQRCFVQNRDLSGPRARILLKCLFYAFAQLDGEDNSQNI